MVGHHHVGKVDRASWSRSCGYNYASGKSRGPVKAARMIQGQFDVGDGFVYQDVSKCFGHDVLDKNFATRKREV